MLELKPLSRLTKRSGYGVYIFDAAHLYNFYIFWMAELTIVPKFRDGPRILGVAVMSWLPIELGRHFVSSGEVAPGSGVSPRVRLLGAVLRIAFIAILVVATVHVSMPQNETLWTVYDTVGDLIRVILGLAVCVWLVAQLFTVPKDARGYETWIHFGMFAVPFALICLVATW
jgi:hypothetical protein